MIIYLNLRLFRVLEVILDGLKKFIILERSSQNLLRKLFLDFPIFGRKLLPIWADLVGHDLVDTSQLIFRLYFFEFSDIAVIYLF